MQMIKDSWARARGIPLDMVGAYFHVYPTNSVQSMHMHMVDLREENINPHSFDALEHKNFPLEEAIAYFEQLQRGRENIAAAQLLELGQ